MLSTGLKIAKGNQFAKLVTSVALDLARMQRDHALFARKELIGVALCAGILLMNLVVNILYHNNAPYKVPYNPELSITYGTRSPFSSVACFLYSS